MHLRPLLVASLLVVGSSASYAETSPPVDKSPSRDKIRWLGAKTSLETTAQYDYVFAGKTSFGNGQYGRVAESEFMLRQIITSRYWRAVLLHGGVEWERFDFNPPDSAFIPENLNDLNAYVGVDFRFSRKDMIRFQIRPGIYTDYERPDMGDVNYPMVFAYSHMVNHKFQWAVGLSLNRWREHPLLGAGGFRWQINDRWKLKMMLPEPQFEYKARDDLHLSAGGDFRGDSFRVGPQFGTQRGNPAFDNAIVDYQELRANIGFSWNIKPLVELNGRFGYMLDRAFNYHNNSILLSSEPSPYLTLNLQILFEMWKDKEPSLETKGQQFQIPDLERVLPNVPKIFDNP